MGEILYSDGILTSFSQILVTAGQIAMNAQEELVGQGDIEGQTTQIMKNMKDILAKSNMSFNNVIKVNMYLVNINDLPKVITIRNHYLKDNRPVATAIEVKRLANPDFLIEMELIAVK